MTAVIIGCVLKKSKLVSFCVAIFILKIEENMQLFAYNALLFQKGKNATEMQKKKKIFAVYGEGAVADYTSQK